MKKALVLAAALLATASFAFGQLCELDLDGVVGNGPDFIVAEVSDYILVDVYMTVGPMTQSVGCNIGNFDGSLEYQGTEYFLPSWGVVAPAPGEVLAIQGTDWSMAALIDMSAPYKVATLTFHAAVDCSVDDLVVIDGGGFDAMNGTVNFTELVGCTVQIGTSATEESSWGAVKGLFR